MASVDVAIPCYQHGRFLRACVEGVLDQGIEGSADPHRRQRLHRRQPGRGTGAGGGGPAD